MNIQTLPNMPLIPADGFATKSNKYGATLYFGENVAAGVNAKVGIYVSPEALRSLVNLLAGIAAKYGPAPDVPEAFRDGWERN